MASGISANCAQVNLAVRGCRGLGQLGEFGSGQLGRPGLLWPRRTGLIGVMVRQLDCPGQSWLRSTRTFVLRSTWQSGAALAQVNWAYEAQVNLAVRGCLGSGLPWLRSTWPSCFRIQTVGSDSVHNQVYFRIQVRFPLSMYMNRSTIVYI